MAGWVRLHRCIMDKAIWKNHNLYRVFSWCIMKATWQPYETIVGMTKVVLEPGQFIFGRHEAAAELLMKPSTVFDCMKWLKANSTIDIKSDNKKSVITIINWPLYQSGEDEPDTKSDNSSDNNATTSRQQADTNKKGKNTKKDKKVKNVKEEIQLVFSELETALQDFREMRVRLKCPLTDRAEKLILDKLNGMATTDEEKIAILNQSTMNGWRGIFELKQDIQKKKGKSIQDVIKELEEDDKDRSGQTY